MKDDLKSLVDVEEQFVIRKQEVAERAIKTAIDFKHAAKMPSKFADDAKWDHLLSTQVLLLYVSSLQRRTYQSFISFIEK